MRAGYMKPTIREVLRKGVCKFKIQPDRLIVSVRANLDPIPQKI